MSWRRQFASGLSGPQGLALGDNRKSHDGDPRSLGRSNFLSWSRKSYVTRAAV